MLFVVRVETGAAFAPLAEAGLELAGIAMSSYTAADTGAVRFESFHAERADAAALAEELEERLAEWGADAGWTVQVATLDDAVWREGWKDFFKTERVSPNVVVRPPWEPAAGGVRCEIELNPGLSFGTGRHFTTRTCLQTLDRLSVELPGAALLDAGCGSGILAIAAAKLGYAPVAGFDNDPQAVAVARENAAINGVAAAVTLTVADVADLPGDGRFAVVVANLYGAILARYAGRLAACAAAGAGSRIVLAGMLNAQVAAVQAAFAAAGWRTLDTETDAEWTTAVLGRASVRPARGGRRGPR